jgi:hypothetical protein
MGQDEKNGVMPSGNSESDKQKEDEPEREELQNTEDEPERKEPKSTDAEPVDVSSKEKTDPSEQKIHDILKQYGWTMYTDSESGRIYIDRPGENPPADNGAVSQSGLFHKRKKRSAEEINYMILRVVRVIIIVINCCIFPVCIFYAIKTVLAFNLRSLIYAAFILMASYFVNPFSIIKTVCPPLKDYIRDYCIALAIYFMGVMVYALY